MPAPPLWEAQVVHHSPHAWPGQRPVCRSVSPGQKGAAPPTLGRPVCPPNLSIGRPVDLSVCQSHSQSYPLSLSSSLPLSLQCLLAPPAPSHVTVDQVCSFPNNTTNVDQRAKHPHDCDPDPGRQIPSCVRAYPPRACLMRVANPQHLFVAAARTHPLRALRQTLTQHEAHRQDVNFTSRNSLQQTLSAYPSPACAMAAYAPPAHVLREHAELC